MNKKLSKKVLKVLKLGKRFGDSDVWADYQEPLEFFQTNSLPKILTNERMKENAKERSLQFLSGWGSCFPFKSKEERRVVVDALIQKLEEVKDKLQKVQGIDLLGKGFTQRSTIRGLYKTFFADPRKGGKGVEGCGATISAKFLHLLSPTFFVPWDQDIKTLYGYSEGKPKEYVAFLEKIRNISIGLLDEYEGRTKEEAKVKMIEESSSVWNEQGKPFLKMLDEFNWYSLHKGKEIGVALKEKPWDLKQVFKELGDVFNIDFKMEMLET